MCSSVLGFVWCTAPCGSMYSTLPPVSAESNQLVYTWQDRREKQMRNQEGGGRKIEVNECKEQFLWLLGFRSTWLFR